MSQIGSICTSSDNSLLYIISLSFHALRPFSLCHFIRRFILIFAEHYSELILPAVAHASFISARYICHFLHFVLCCFSRNATATHANSKRKPSSLFRSSAAAGFSFSHGQHTGTNVKRKPHIDIVVIGCKFIFKKGCFSV
jgi:hypothetical protein